MSERDDDGRAVRRRARVDTGSTTGAEPRHRPLAPGKRSLTEWEHGGGRAEHAAPSTARDVVASALNRVREADVHLARLVHANRQRDHVLSALECAAVRACLDAAREQLSGATEAAAAREAQSALESLSAEAEPHLARAFQPRPGAQPFASSEDEGARVAWSAMRDEEPTPECAEARGAVEIAARGVSGAPRALPHLSLIQSSFGPEHDVSQIGAHIDDAAATASAQLGAEAFALGEQVAFSRAPDLHTAAHEAAHVMQQQRGVAPAGGIDGGPGDALEQHADAVADRVVRGESAAPLLAELAGSAPTSGTSAVQRKTRGAPASQPAPAAEGEVADAATPGTVTAAGAAWPVLAATGKAYQIVSARDPVELWFVRDWIRAGAGFREQGTHAVSPACAAEILRALGWIPEERIDQAAAAFVFPLSRRVGFARFTASVHAFTGLPTGQPVVSRARDGSSVQVALPVAVPDGTRLQIGDEHRTLLIRALARFTGLTPVSGALASLRGDPRYAEAEVQAGVALCTLTEDAGNHIFGFDEESDEEGPYSRWLRRQADQAQRRPDEPKLALRNFYGMPIPGALRVHRQLVEAGQPVWLELAVKWPTYYPSEQEYAVEPMVTPGHAATVAILDCAWDIELVEPAGVAKTSARTIRTEVAELHHAFVLPPGVEQGTFRVTVRAARDAYFEPATFTLPVEVKSTEKAMGDLRAEAAADLGAREVTRQRASFDASGSGDDNQGFRTTGELPESFTPSRADGPDPRAGARQASRDRLAATRVYLEANGAKRDVLEAVDRELEAAKSTEAALAADRAKGWQPFQIRGTYLSRTDGLPSGPLSLYGSVYATPVLRGPMGDTGWELVTVQIRDLSRRFDNEDLRFTGTGTTFEEALKDAFTDHAKAYPKGLVAIEAEAVDARVIAGKAQIRGGTRRTIGFQLGTDSRWKRFKAKVWSPFVNVAVNLGGMALMAFVPGSAVVVAPALVAYNTVPTVDHMIDQANRGTATLGSTALSVGEIALNVLPLVARARPFTNSWFVIEGANWGGQAVLMTASAIQVAHQLQANDVAALAAMYDELQRLEAAGGDPAAIEQKRREIMHRAKEVSDRIAEQLREQIQVNAMFAVAGSIIHRANGLNHDEANGIIEAYLRARTGAGDDASTGAANRTDSTARPDGEPGTGGDPRTTGDAARSPAPDAPRPDAGAASTSSGGPVPRALGEVIARQVPGVRYVGNGEFLIESGGRTVTATVRRVQQGDEIRFVEDGDAIVIEVPRGTSEVELEAAMVGQLRQIASATTAGHDIIEVRGTGADTSRRDTDPTERTASHERLADRSHRSKAGEASTSKGDATAMALGPEAVEVSLQVALLRPVVDGHVYEGTPAQIKAALRSATKLGLELEPTYDKSSRTWRVRAGERVFELRERAASTKADGGEPAQGHEPETKTTELIQHVGAGKAFGEQHAHAPGSVPIGAVLGMLDEWPGITAAQRAQQIDLLERMIREFTAGGRQDRAVSDLSPEKTAVRDGVVEAKEKVTIASVSGNADIGLLNKMLEAKRVLAQGGDARAIEQARGKFDESLTRYRETVGMQKPDDSTYDASIDTTYEFFVRYKMIAAHGLGTAEIAARRASAEQLGMQELRYGSDKSTVATLHAEADQLLRKAPMDADVSNTFATTKNRLADSDPAKNEQALMVEFVKAWHADPTMERAFNGFESAGVEDASKPPVLLWEAAAHRTFRNAIRVRERLAEAIPSPDDARALALRLARIRGTTPQQAEATLSAYRQAGYEAALGAVEQRGELLRSQGTGTATTLAVDPVTQRVTERFAGLGMEDVAADTRAITEALRTWSAETGAQHGDVTLLGMTMHAGEQLLNPKVDPFTLLDQVDQAVSLGTDRIGHGLILGIEPEILVAKGRLPEHRIDEFRARQREVVEHVRARGVVIEANLSSNTEISNLTQGQHPAGRFVEKDLRVTVNTDDETVLKTTLQREFDRVSRVPGVTRHDIAAMILEAYRTRMGNREIHQRGRIKPQLEAALLHGLSPVESAALASHLSSYFHVAPGTSPRATIRRVLDVTLGL